jgi:hypothetical protein
MFRSAKHANLVRGLGMLILVGWTGWVAWRYRLVDGGLHPIPSRSTVMFIVSGALVAAVVGGLTAIFCRIPTHPSRQAAAACALVIVLFSAWAKLGESLLAQPDFTRLTGVLLFGAAGGTGFAFVCRRSRFHRSLLCAFLLFPFFALSLYASWGTAFLCVVITLAASAGIGRSLQDRLVPDVYLERSAGALLVTVRLALGLLILSFIGFVLGLVHFAYTHVLLSSVIVALIVTRRALRREISSLRGFLSASERDASASSWVTGTIWALLLIAWIAALAPEVGPDAIGGRQAIVGLWASDHSLSGYRELILSYMATGGETLFLTLYPLAGEQSSKLGQFVAVLTMLPALAGFARGRTVARVLLLAFGASSLVFVQFAWGFVDFVQTLFYFGAMVAGFLWWRKPHRGMLFIAALLGAGAATVKLNGLGALLILGLVVMVNWCRSPRSLRPLVQDALMLSAAAAIVLGPWFLRSFLLTGNPIFPYANGFFESPMAPTELIAKRYGDPVSLASLAQIPWRVFMEPGRYNEIGTYHPLLLAAFPLIIPGLLSVRTGYWIMTGLASSLLWFVSEQNLRYSLFAGLLLAFGGTLILDRWLTTSSANWRSLAASVAACLFFSGLYIQLSRPTSWLFQTSDGSASPLSVVLDLQSNDEYLASHLRHVPLLRHIDRTFGAEAVVWELPWLRDHLHLKGRAIALPHCDYRLALKLRSLLDLTPSPENDKQLHSTLRTLGITHLLLTGNPPWAPSVPGRPFSALYSGEFLRSAARIEAANYGYVLYSLHSEFRDRSESALGPNLFLNPEFLPSPGPEVPAGWNQSGSLNRSRQSALSIPPGSFLYQQVQVEASRLYRMEVRFADEPSALHGAVLQTAWRDTDGRLLLYNTFPIAATHTEGIAAFFQTAPESANTLDVTMTGPVSPYSIALQTVDAPER